MYINRKSLLLVSVLSLQSHSSPTCDTISGQGAILLTAIDKPPPIQITLKFFIFVEIYSASCSCLGVGSVIMYKFSSSKVWSIFLIIFFMSPLINPIWNIFFLYFFFKNFFSIISKFPNTKICFMLDCKFSFLINFDPDNFLVLRIILPNMPSGQSK